MRLAWAVKESFQRYVEGNEGTITISEPASRDGFDIVFPGIAETESIWAFQGEVHFEAHGGVLSVHIADPVIEWQGLDGMLTVRASSGMNARPVPFARLRASDGTIGSAAAHLTPGGARMLGDVYAPGTLIEPLKFAD